MESNSLKGEKKFEENMSQAYLTRKKIQFPTFYYDR
jgi:hypothetical protein